VVFFFFHYFYDLWLAVQIYMEIDYHKWSKSTDAYPMKLDFVELEKSFFNVFEPHGRVFIEIVLAHQRELDADQLWQNCKQIEKIWESILLKHKNKLKWIFFGDYPINISSYIYNNRIYGKKLILNHINRGILLFDLIPLTISYKNIKSNFENEAYINVFTKFGIFREQKWILLKDLIDESTKFALTYTRQDGYKKQLEEECEHVLDNNVEIISWNHKYSTSYDISDRMEKMMLIFT
jgi:hypothetical protein